MEEICLDVLMESTKIPCGFRFDPDDEQLIYYLARKAAGYPSELKGFVKEDDLYGDQEPSEYFKGTLEKTRYFLTRLKKKSKNRIDRRVGNKGTWVGQNMKLIKDGTRRNIIGRVRNFFYQRKDKLMPGGCKWLMKEYSLPDDVLKHAIYKDYVLCRIKKKDQQEDSERTGEIVQQGAGVLETMVATGILQPPWFQQQGDDDFHIMITGSLPSGNTEYYDVSDSIMLQLATVPALIPAEATMEGMVLHEENNADLEMIMKLLSTPTSDNTESNVLESVLQLDTVPALTPTEATMEEMAQLQRHERYEEMVQLQQQGGGEENQEMMLLQQQERDGEMVQFQQQEREEEMFQIQLQERGEEMVQLQQQGRREENQEMMLLQQQERDGEMVQFQQQEREEMFQIQPQERGEEMVQLQHHEIGEDNQEMMQFQLQERGEEIVPLQQEEIRDATIFTAREDEASGLRNFTSDQWSQFDYFDIEHMMPQGTGYEQHMLAINFGSTDTELDTGMDLWTAPQPYYYPK